LLGDEKPDYHESAMVGATTGLTPERVRKLSFMPPVCDPRTWGRDLSNPYYDLLYRLVVELSAGTVLELGTCEGGSASFLAAGGARQVVTVDIEPRPESSERLRAFPSVEAWHGDTLSHDIYERASGLGALDLLFIDTVHTPEQASAELEKYGPLVRAGGIIALDDVRIDPAMAGFWDAVRGQKVELPWLHRTGFGVVLV
jgi:cephalosporin hydroxylase